MTLTPWRKSTFSSEPDGNCVEVALAPAAVAVRDSKYTSGPTLSVPITGWHAFMTSCRCSRFALS